MKIFSRALKFAASAALQFYRTILSPCKIVLFGPLARCRFHPTCSQFALKAFARYNFCRAFYFSARRIMRCNPLWRRRRWKFFTKIRGKELTDKKFMHRHEKTRIADGDPWIEAKGAHNARPKFAPNEKISANVIIAMDAANPPRNALGSVKHVSLGKRKCKLAHGKFRKIIWKKLAKLATATKSTSTLIDCLSFWTGKSG
ncbi:MAG: membrane protein insertion efficiency factor YidD [Puniceicoccales bacterium]|jgi:putative membrane protein insertion efficiency factor|nr:membrane protein insertion efficiency factor YidD [Puniceicoccales bacterium]